jgi:hypothetical protein
MEISQEARHAGIAVVSIPLWRAKQKESADDRISLPCPICGETRNKVIDSRPTFYKQGLRPKLLPTPFIRRRRECMKCGYRFTSRETVYEDDPLDFQI